jgi:5-methylcytosine-specific restriction endonuclease McrA
VSVLVAEGDDIRAVSTPRPTIPRRVRRRLEHRDPVCANHRCRGDGPFEIDHVVPRSEGGQTELENLWRLCRHCHRLKTYFGWVVDVDVGGNRVLVAPGGPDPP